MQSNVLNDLAKAKRRWTEKKCIFSNCNQSTTLDCTSESFVFLITLHKVIRRAQGDQGVHASPIMLLHVICIHADSTGYRMHLCLHCKH